MSDKIERLRGELRDVRSDMAVMSQIEIDWLAEGMSCECGSFFVVRNVNKCISAMQSCRINGCTLLDMSLR